MTASLDSNASSGSRPRHAKTEAGGPGASGALRKPVEFGRLRKRLEGAARSEPLLDQSGPMTQNSFPAGSCNTRVVQSPSSARDTNDAPAARIFVNERLRVFHEEVEVNSSFGGLRFRNGLKGQERRSVRAPVSSLERDVRSPSRAGSARVAEAAFPERGELCRVRAIHRDSDPL